MCGKNSARDVEGTFTSNLGGQHIRDDTRRRNDDKWVFHIRVKYHDDNDLNEQVMIV